MTSEPLAPGAPAVILYREVARDDNGDTPHEDNYIRIKILTDAGRRYGNVEVPFYKKSSDVVHVKARTIGPDGSITEFDGQVFEKTVVKERGFKLLVKAFSLPNVQIGSVIEYSFVLQFNRAFVYDSHWLLSEELFTKRANFSLSPYHSPSSRFPVHLSWVWHNLPIGSVGPSQGTNGVITLEASNIPAFPIEDHMPPPNELKSRVDFIYGAAPSAKDPEKFWKTIGQGRYAGLEEFIGKQKAMEQAVATIVSPGDPPEIKLRKIYERVQSLRNTTYELSKTQQEERREREKPVQNVEELWKKGYGDSVQLTWLFLALARAAGFEAYGVWVGDRRNYFFNAQSCESAKLDANVVLVKLDGKDLYFDPGAPFTPYGLLTWSETGVPGLRLDKDGGTWVRTVLPASSESTIERSAKLHLSETGDVEGTVTVTFTGLEAMYRRLEERNSDDVERKKLLEEEIRKQVPGTAEVELRNAPDWTSSKLPLVAQFNLKLPGWASNAGRRVIVPVNFFAAPEKSMFEHATRVHPIYFEFMYQKIDDVSLELPPGWQVLALPASKKQDGQVITYSLSADSSGGKVHIDRKVSFDMLLLEQKYYGALRDFLQSIRTGDEQQFILQPGTPASRD